MRRKNKRQKTERVRQKETETAQRRGRGVKGLKSDNEMKLGGEKSAGQYKGTRSEWER